MHVSIVSLLLPYHTFTLLPIVSCAPFCDIAISSRLNKRSRKCPEALRKGINRTTVCPNLEVKPNVKRSY